MTAETYSVKGSAFKALRGKQFTIINRETGARYTVSIGPEKTFCNYGAELETFARETLAARGSRRKSLPLLQGTLSFRTLPAALRVADAETAYLHARTACPELIETRQELNTTAYRELTEATGELLPGIEAVPERESFRVRFGRETGQDAN
jgi:hypothetical protein